MGRRKGTGCRVGNTVSALMAVLFINPSWGFPMRGSLTLRFTGSEKGGLSAVGPDAVAAELNTNGLVKWTLSNQLHWLLEPF